MRAERFYVANDRIWISCKKCKARTLLFKHYPGGLGYVFPERLDTFMSQHISECRGNPLHLDGDPGFALATDPEPAGWLAQKLSELLRKK